MVADGEQAPACLVLWDIDGTLLDPAGFGWRLAQTAFHQVYGTPLEATVARAGRTDRSIYSDILVAARPQRIPDDVDRLCATAGELAGRPEGVLDLWQGGAKALPGATEAVRAVAKRPDILQSVLTGNLRAVAEVKLGILDIADLLDLSVAEFGDNHLQRSALIDDARSAFAHRYGHPPEDVVLVGDTPLDVEAARIGRTRVVAVASGEYSVADLHAAGAAVVLPDLLDPARVIDAIRSAPQP